MDRSCLGELCTRDDRLLEASSACWTEWLHDESLSSALRYCDGLHAVQTKDLDFTKRYCGSTTVSVWEESQSP